MPQTTLAPTGAADLPAATVISAPADTITVAPPPDTTTPPSSTPPSTTPPSTTPPSTMPSIASLGLVDDATVTASLTVPPQGPAPTLRLIGFGDSVMLGSANQLAARGFVVDAVQSRQLSAAIPELQAIRDNGFLGSAVVIHLGTNGSFPQSSLDEIMSILDDVPIVVWVTGKADRVWIPGNNEKIRALPAAYSNVSVIDWEVLGPQCIGDCFYGDGIHLNGDGQRYYADLVARVLGI